MVVKCLILFSFVHIIFLEAWMCTGPPRHPPAPAPNQKCLMRDDSRFTQLNLCKGAGNADVSKLREEISAHWSKQTCLQNKFKL